MEFVSAKRMVDAASQGGYAVPALNTNGGTYDITRAALEAAEDLQAPVILQVYEPNAGYRGFEYFVNQARFLCDQLSITVPVALQVDHGHSLESLERAIRAGFTSVMFDASHDPIETNIARTREVVEVAKRTGVSVEAEIGYVKGNEPVTETQVGRIPVPEKPTIPPAKTEVEDAVRFVQEVDVDMVAVSVGTTHGVYRSQTSMDFELLGALKRALPVPLVQHGTGGIAPKDLTRLAKAGMAKINFGEPFRYDYINHFCELTDSMEHLWHPWRIMQEVKERLKTSMRQLILACGADGKA